MAGLSAIPAGVPVASLRRKGRGQRKKGLKKRREGEEKEESEREEIKRREERAKLYKLYYMLALAGCVSSAIHYMHHILLEPPCQVALRVNFTFLAFVGTPKMSTVFSPPLTRGFRAASNLFTPNLRTFMAKYGIV